MIHRFFVQQKFPVGEVFVESLQIVHQLTKVLRIRAGETVVFFNGDGYDYPAKILLYGKESVKVSIGKKIKNKKELPVSLILRQSLIKKDAIEWVLEKATELGVVDFRPFLSSRSVKKDFPMERGKKIIREAAEQSGRAIVPSVSEPISFSDALEAARGSGNLSILFHPNTEESADLPEFMEMIKKSKAHFVHIFIGPEGGFTDEEIQEARARGVKIVSVFPTTLRAETAAIVFSGLLAAIVHRG